MNCTLHYLYVSFGRKIILGTYYWKYNRQTHTICGQTNEGYGWQLLCSSCLVTLGSEMVHEDLKKNAGKMTKFNDTGFEFTVAN